ncbi:MAG: hypothetical protein PHT51_03890 [Patescibacteria group bacterium]|nr:hypothetical protein [Patescibacteria group bacterium]MDD4610407.1 hypothetical protein [Patescibacteria group bacterium]
MKKNKKLIIGLVGQIACGKGAIAKYAQEKYKASSYRFSTILRDAMDILCIGKSRKNINDFSEFIRKRYGEDTFAKVIYKQVVEDNNKIIIVDGIRRLMDIKYLKKLPEFKLVKVTADINIRLERLRSRNENIGDDKRTLKSLMADQSREADAQIPQVMKQADLEIVNEGTFQDLQDATDKIIKKYL